MMSSDSSHLDDVFGEEVDSRGTTDLIELMTKTVSGFCQILSLEFMFCKF